jgi:hypothetical protein
MLKKFLIDVTNKVKKRVGGPKTNEGTSQNKPRMGMMCK